MLMNMNARTPPDILPAWLARATAPGVLCILLALGVLIAFIAAGATDPPVAGPVIWADEAFGWVAARQTWASAPVTLSTTSAAFTVTVRARLPADADPSAAWGIWLAEEDGSRVIYAINAAGYWTIRRCPAQHSAAAPLEDCPALRPEWRWLFHPRLHPAGDTNSIALHREPDGAIRLRVNGERLGAASIRVAGTWGVWAWADGVSPVWERAELRINEKGGRLVG